MNDTYIGQPTADSYKDKKKEEKSYGTKKFSQYTPPTMYVWLGWHKILRFNEV